jgi:hypothetical protein
MERFLQQPHGGTALANTMNRLRSGHWPEWYVDTICQPWQTYAGGAWPMEQVHAFMFIDYWIGCGALAIVDIEVGEEPHRDSARAENQAALDKVAAPFVATVDQTQHCAEGDGTLTWNDRIGVSFLAEPGEWNTSNEPTWAVGAVTKTAEVPLEIGTTLASTSIGHFSESRALARWPYGSKSIRLFLCTERFAPYAEDRHGNVRRFTPPSPMDQRHLRRPEDLTKETTDG